MHERKPTLRVSFQVFSASAANLDGIQMFFGSSTWASRQDQWGEPTRNQRRVAPPDHWCYPLNIYIYRYVYIPYAFTCTHTCIYICIRNVVFLDANNMFSHDRAIIRLPPPKTPRRPRLALHLFSAQRIGSPTIRATCRIEHLHVRIRPLVTCFQW